MTLLSLVSLPRGGVAASCHPPAGAPRDSLWPASTAGQGTQADGVATGLTSREGRDALREA